MITVPQAAQLLALLPCLLLSAPGTAADAPEGESAPMTSILQTLELHTDFQQTAALYRLLERSDVEDVKRFIAEAQSLENPLDRAAGLNIIYGRFADLDPDAAVDHLLNESGTASVEILFTLFSSWAKVDLDSAIAKSRGLRVQRNRQIAEQAILMARVAQGSDVNELAGRMNSDASDQLRMLEAVQVLTLAQTDPQAAMQQALETKNWEMQNRIVAQIATMWAEQDDQAAMRYSRSIAAENPRLAFQGALLNRLAQTRPEAAIEYIHDDAFSEQERSGFLTRVFLSLAKSDPELAYHQATGLRAPGDRERAMGLIINTLKQHDPVRAFELLQLVTEPAIIRRYAGEVLEQYAGIEPRSALQWAEQQDDHRQEYLNIVISVIAKWDPEQALTLVSEMPGSQSRTQALATVIRQLANKEPATAIEFLDLLGTGALRYQTTNEVAVIWMTQEPVAALDWIKSLPSRQQESLLSPLAGRLVHDNLDLAKALLPELTKDSVRKDWISAIARQMVNTDTPAAVSWLGQFRSDPVYSEVVADMIGPVARTDVPGALKLAEEIQDEAEYARAAGDALGVWAMQDAPAAAAWATEYGILANSPFTTAIITRSWAESDVHAAMSWATQLAAPEVRDVALSTLVGNAYLSTVQVHDLIAGISDPSELKHAANTYVQGLARYDLAEARSQLKALNLPVEIEAELEATLAGLE